MKDFRLLYADEIDCRVAQINEKGCSLLLYKNARVDMAILDETVGKLNWCCDYKVVKDNMYCGIGIKDEKTGEWVYKWDCGVESFSEAEKGEASDAFKRSGFKWGIGRSLYTAPFIYIPASLVNIINKNGKYSTYDKFKVEKIMYDEKGIINAISIINNIGKRVFAYNNKKGGE